MLGGTNFDTTYEAVSNAATVEEAVVLVRDAYGLDNATYHLAQVPGSSVDGPYVRSTYPANWLTRYLLKGYIHVDPVVREGFSRMLPFNWRELTLTPAAADLFADFQNHGLAAQGYSVPLIDKLARRALFSVNARVDDDSWTAFIAGHGEGLAEIAYLIHRKAVREIHGDKDPLPQLGRRELECLSWAAQGKTAKEIAAILGIAEFTVRDYLVSARHKLQSENLTKAIARAVALHLIRA